MPVLHKMCSSKLNLSICKIKFRAVNMLIKIADNPTRSEGAPSKTAVVVLWLAKHVRLIFYCTSLYYKFFFFDDVFSVTCGSFLLI